MSKFYPVTTAEMWACINTLTDFDYRASDTQGHMSRVHEGFYVVIYVKFPVGICEVKSRFWMWDVTKHCRIDGVNYVSSTQVFDVYRRGMPALAALKLMGII